ncbi:MAG: hypothetical protein ACOCVL_00005 [Candidatus Sumerlaeota bacterium]
MAIKPLLCSLFTTMQQHLVSFQEELLDELPDKTKTLTELAGNAKFMLPSTGQPISRPHHKRQPIVVAFPPTFQAIVITNNITRMNLQCNNKGKLKWVEWDSPMGGRKVVILSEKRTIRCL